MDSLVLALDLAAGVSMLLVMFSAYMLVHSSRGDLARGFRIVLAGYLPGALLHFARAAVYSGILVLPPDNGKLFNELFLASQIIGALSLFFAIYVAKTTLLDKIANFARKAKGGG